MAGYGLGDTKRMVPSDVIDLLYRHGWHDAEKLTLMACTVDAESGCYPHAWHWNAPQDGGNGSTDWGLFQLNDNNVGGSAPEVTAAGLPVAKTEFQRNALAPEIAADTARKMYEARGFSPWFGYAKWKNYAPEMTRALCNWLRKKWGIAIL